MFGLVAHSPVALGQQGTPDQTGTGGGIFDDAGNQASLEDPHAIPPGQSVSVSSFGHIDLHVKDLEISRVLQLLSIQSQRNIVASRNVAGTISADLYSVEFYDALDAILQPNGFGYREKGNFVYVYTAAEIKEIEEAERKLTSRIVKLNYITATDASTFVTPLLSPNGSISLSGETAAGFQPSIADGGANEYAHTDTLLIRDYSENVDEIVTLIGDLDVRPKQVLVEATILQAEIGEANAFGVDFSILGEYTLNQFIKPLNTVDALINGTVDGEVDSIFQAVGNGESIQSTVGNTLNGESGVKFGILNSEFAVFVRALDRVRDTTIIANPKILVVNRQRADLLVGGRLGYLSTTSTESSTTQTVEFLDIGTQLTVRPFVSDDDYIRMELRPSISDGSTSAIDGVVIPNETTQELTTNIMMRTGQTVVLGGLFKEDTVISRSQWPFLGDIPVIGNAFKGKDDDVNRSEVIFLVKPTIIKDEALNAAGDRAAEGIEHVRLGARHGLLPWSRTKLTAGHMRDALKHYRMGHTDKALWCVNLALWLDPKLAEARRLKEEITGTLIGDWPGRGILNDAVDRLVQDQLHASAETDDSLERQDVEAVETINVPVESPAEPAQPQAKSIFDIEPSSSNTQEASASGGSASNDQRSGNTTAKTNGVSQQAANSRNTNEAPTQASANQPASIRQSPSQSQASATETTGEAEPSASATAEVAPQSSEDDWAQLPAAESNTEDPGDYELQELPESIEALAPQPSDSPSESASAEAEDTPADAQQADEDTSAGVTVDQTEPF